MPGLLPARDILQCAARGANCETAGVRPERAPSSRRVLHMSLESGGAKRAGGNGGRNRPHPALAALVVADFICRNEEATPLNYSIGFRILSCSWPRPVENEKGVWLSDPEWDTPEMPDVPILRYEEMEGRVGVAINWCEFFRGNFLTFSTGGEMRG